MEIFIPFFLSVTIFHNGVARMVFNVYTEKVTRYSAHSPTVLLKTCLLIPDTGPCRGNIPMYYFDPSSQNCSEFKWGGCQGNGNRFDTEDECIDHCLSKSNTIKKRPNWCNLAFDYGYCFGALERYYFDPLWKVCKSTIYSGCGGNKNNFYSKEKCDQICRFGIGVISSDSSKSGSRNKKVIIINPETTSRHQETTRMGTICVNTTIKG